MAWNIFELSVNMFQVTIMIETVTRYLKPKYTGLKRNIYALLAILAVFAELTYINSRLAFEGLAIIIPAGMIFIYALIALRGSWMKKMFITIMIMVIVLGVTAIVMNVMGILFGKTYMQLVLQQNALRFIAVIIIQICIFHATRILLLKNNENDVELTLDAYSVILILPCISLLILSSIIELTLHIAPEFQENGTIFVAIISIGIFIIDILTYLMYKKLKKDAAEKTEYEILKQRFEMQQKNINDRKPLYLELQKIRHDTKHHMNLMKILLEKKENEEALKYLEEYTGAIYSDIGNTLLCDNVMINYIVNSKTRIMEKKNIRFQCNICDQIHGIPDVDITIILGNLLDNAIEACDHISDEKKDIILSIYRKAGYLIISVKNTFDDSIELTGKLETSKKDKEKHGYGLLSVKDVAEKHNGYFNLKRNDKIVEGICVLEIDSKIE